jgi:hypothetical protein
MTFAELLKHATEAGEGLEKASAAMESARSAVHDTEAAYDAALAAKHAADKALHDLLKSKGVHYTFALDGTVVFYTACEAGPGWCAQHPIPSTTPDES